MIDFLLPEGKAWYPPQIQLWIWGMALLVALVLFIALWLLWRRPLTELRSTIEDSEAYRELMFQRSVQEISDITTRAERELLDVVTMARRKALDEGFGRYLDRGDTGPWWSDRQSGPDS